jgi:FixJ family two-component response regulator
MSGPELARRLRRTHPHVKVVFMSGYTDHAVAHQHVLDTASQFLQKPFTTEELLVKVRTALDGRV